MRAAHALMAILLTGCAAAEATTPPHGPTPAPAAGSAAPAEPTHTELGLDPGESMSFEVKLAGVAAGEAQLAVGQIGTDHGHREIVVTSRAQTSGVAAMVKSITDETKTVIDADSGRPLEFDTRVVNNDTTATAHAAFTGSIVDVSWTKSGGDGKDEQKQYRVDFGAVIVHNADSAMAQLRGWRATPGAKKSVYVVGGKRLWRIDLTLGKVEPVTTQMGPRRATRYDGAAFSLKKDLAQESAKPARTFTVWLSDDADRVPLRLVAKTELGDVAIELVEYNKP